jgi:hypothetical protein
VEAIPETTQHARSVVEAISEATARCEGIGFASSGGDPQTNLGYRGRILPFVYLFSAVRLGFPIPQPFRADSVIDDGT